MTPGLNLAKKEAIQLPNDEGFEVLHLYPIEQESLHCFNYIDCSCTCCFPDVTDEREDLGQVIVDHKWVQ